MSKRLIHSSSFSIYSFGEYCNKNVSFITVLVGFVSIPTAAFVLLYSEIRSMGSKIEAKFDRIERKLDSLISSLHQFDKRLIVIETKEEIRKFETNY